MADAATFAHSFRLMSATLSLLVAVLEPVTGPVKSVVTVEAVPVGIAAMSLGKTRVAVLPLKLRSYLLPAPHIAWLLAREAPHLQPPRQTAITPRSTRSPQLVAVAVE